ncbi:MAG: VanW family protein [Lachnospiraceae bacterium]|nr:VanW family protein [Lachnospiraceae bacterium]
MFKRLICILLIPLLLFLGTPALTVGASAEEFTPEQYVGMMLADPAFDIRAYMYYNEDLMSSYTYDYWRYYRHYLQKGRAEGRIALFPETDTFHTVTLGRYTTQYKTNTDRGKNVELACDYLNGTVIMPGESFSYNGAIGVRSTARGFRPATIYVSGQKATGIGGGICQISSTTYVAMMIAGIYPTERHVHSLPVSYLKKNLDATVVYGKLDLKFVNPYEFPIMVRAYYDGNGNCTVEIDRCALPPA